MKPPVAVSPTVQEYAGLRWYLCGPYFQREHEGRLHRQVWRDAHPGEVLPGRGWDVHHRDENKLNNHPDNLVLTTRSAHQRHHSSNPTPKQRAARRENIKAASAGNRLIPAAQRGEASRRGWEKVQRVEVECEVCGEPFDTPYPERAQYCGGTCRARARRARLRSS